MERKEVEERGRRPREEGRCVVVVVVVVVCVRRKNIFKTFALLRGRVVLIEFALPMCGWVVKFGIYLIF